MTRDWSQKARRDVVSREPSEGRAGHFLNCWGYLQSFLGSLALDVRCVVTLSVIGIIVDDLALRGWVLRASMIEEGTRKT
jgi:hypothetical protein